MSKEYQIVNSNFTNDCVVLNLLYVVLFIVVVIVIWKLANLYKHTHNPNEKFDNFITNENIQKNSTDPTNNLLKNMSQEQLTIELAKKNNELSNIKNVVQETLAKQSKAIYFSQNFNKVDSSSFDNELNFLLYDFASTKFPSVDFEGKKVIGTNEELEKVLDDVSKMKNIYKPGDIVSANSTFGIGPNDICYRNNGIPIKPTGEFVEQYPSCMVCEVEDESHYKNSNAWKNTKTNIKKVCLFNPNAEPNTGIPNLSQCKTFCGI